MVQRINKELKKKNSCANLPYIVDGGLVVSQSNTCALYLGRRLGIDDGMSGTYQTYNHTVLDQTYDLRNDLMKVVCPSERQKRKPTSNKRQKNISRGTCGRISRSSRAFASGPS